MIERAVVAAAAFGALVSFAQADETTPSYSPIPKNIEIETGDTWIYEGIRNRLYGVQACLRGTYYTNKEGQEVDCGDASLAMLAALIQDLKPVCTPVAQAGEKLRFVVCYGSIGDNRVELGTALISSGFAFASLKPDGEPQHMPYYVAEAMAKEKGAGLWAFQDLPHPNIVLREQRSRLQKQQQ